jgi:anti-sigma factor RsiW
MMVDSMAHFKYETLLNYLENQLSAEERGQVDAHTSKCPRCSRRLTLLQGVLQSVDGDRTVAPQRASEAGG